MDEKIGNMKFDAPSKHTGEMVAAEIDSMLGGGRIRLCLGHLMKLARMHSPYVYGGQVNEMDLAMAMSLWPHDAGKEPDPLKFHKDLVAELDAAFRPLELFDEVKKEENGGKRSDIRPFSPEWMSDIMRSAAQAIPSLGYREILWELPLVAVMHLGVAEARANGAITCRPRDIKAALKMMREMMKNQAKENDENGK